MTTRFSPGDFASIIKHPTLAGKLKGWSANQLAALGNACQDDAALVWLQREVPAFNGVWRAKIGNAALASKINNIGQGFPPNWADGYPSVGKVIAYLGPISRKTWTYPPK